MKRILILFSLILAATNTYAQGNIYTYPPAGVTGLSNSGSNIVSTVPILLPNSTCAGTPALSLSAQNKTGLSNPTGSNSFSACANGIEVFRFGQTGTVSMTPVLYIQSDTGVLSFGAGSGDVYVTRDAANTFALRNSTNAQTFNIYNTYTDGSNYEKASLYWSGNNFYLKPLALGTGTKRDIVIGDITLAGGSIYIQSGTGAGVINTVFDGVNAAFAPTGDDAAYTLGKSSAKWSNFYLSRAIQGSKTKTLTETSATSFVQVDLAASTITGGSLNYCIFAKDATNTQARCGSVAFSAARTSGSAITCTVGTPSTDLETVAATSGTLTNTFTCDATAGTNFKLQSNATSSLTQTTLEIHYRLDITDPVIVTPQ